MPTPPPAFAMSIIIRALLHRLSDLAAIREAAIASRIRPWIGEWLASDQTGSAASVPRAQVAETAGLESQSSATLPIGRVRRDGCATSPAAQSLKRTGKEKRGRQQ